MLRTLASDRGTNSRKPEVGFGVVGTKTLRTSWSATLCTSPAVSPVMKPSVQMPRRGYRSEEHTSELQSLMRISYAVFCLKKKKINHNVQHTKKHNRSNHKSD